MYSKEWIKLNYRELSYNLDKRYDYETYNFDNTEQIRSNNRLVLIN